MYSVNVEAHFDSAHFLAGYDGKCSNLHGHRWRVAAVICGRKEIRKTRQSFDGELVSDEKRDHEGNLIETGPCRGMVVDFGDVKRDLAALADELDHTLIYEEGTLREETMMALAAENFRVIALPFRPTAECLAKYFFDRLAEKGYLVDSVEVDESPENRAFYRDDL